MWEQIIGAGAGIASGLLGSRGAKSAAKEQTYIAKKQIKTAKKMRAAQDKLQQGLYEGQSKDILASRDKGISSAWSNMDDQKGYAWDQRRAGQADARTAYDRNSALNRNALSGISGIYTDARDRSIAGLRGAETRSIADLKQGGYGAIQDINGARDAGIGDIRRGGTNAIRGIAGARDASMQDVRSNAWGAIGGINDARDAGISDLRGASGDAIRTLRQSRDASIAGFQPAADMGNNALAAYSSNLGLGKAPAGYAGLGFTPGDQFLLSQGVENIHGSAAGAGTLNSGATLEALERFRSGLAATRRDQSQSELFNLGQLGQNATGSIANIRMGAGNNIAAEQSGLGRDIASLRTGAAAQTGGIRVGLGQDLAGLRTDAAARMGDLRYGMGQDTAALRTGAATQTGAMRYGMGQDIAGVRQDTAGNVANLRTGAAGNLAGAQGAYAAAQAGLNDQNYARQTGLDAGYYGAVSGARNDYTNALSGLRQQYVNDMGTARTNRANLSAEGSAQYGSNALTAMANRGDANAAGAVGSANAWQNALDLGLGIWAYNKGQPAAPNPYNPANGPLGRAEGMAAGNSNPLAGVTNWLGGLFGRAA